MPRSAIVGILQEPVSASSVDSKLSCRPAREMGLPHQPQVDRPGSLAPLVDRPYDERLAATHVAGGEDPLIDTPNCRSYDASCAASLNLMHPFAWGDNIALSPLQSRVLQQHPILTAP